MRLEHDSLVEVPAQGSVFDALVAANLLVPLATALPMAWIEGRASQPLPHGTWLEYGRYDETGDWLEVWVKSEAAIEAERYA